MIWTKADIRRIQSAVDTAWAVLMPFARPGREDAAATALRENVRYVVRTHLRANAKLDEANPKRACEVRAARRIADRLETEPLPSAIRFPGDSPDQSEPDPYVEPVVAEPEPEAPPASQVAASLADLLGRGDVHVHRAGSNVWDTDTAWSSVVGVQTWADWVQPIAVHYGVGDLWQACAVLPYRPGWSGRWMDVPGLTAGWASACRSWVQLPDVLDLRASPLDLLSGGGTFDTWLDALRGAIRRNGRGVVLLVTDHPWALARLLPGKAGGS